MKGWPALERLENTKEPVWEIRAYNMSNIPWKCGTKYSRDQPRVHEERAWIWGDSVQQEGWEASQVKENECRGSGARCCQWFVGVLCAVRLAEPGIIPVDVFLVDAQKHLTLCANTGLLLFLLSMWGESWRYSNHSSCGLQESSRPTEAEELGTSKMRMPPLLQGGWVEGKAQERILLIVTYKLNHL